MKIRVQRVIVNENREQEKNFCKNKSLRYFQNGHNPSSQNKEQSFLVVDGLSE